MFSVYFLLDTFVIAETYQVVESNDSNLAISNTSKTTSTDTYYEDDYIKITITEYYEYDTKIYVADVIIKDSSLLKTAFAKSSYGKNVTAKTSTIADSVNAILAINGDYYGVQESGYVLRNGVIYRDTAKKNQ